MVGRCAGHIYYTLVNCGPQKRMTFTPSALKISMGTLLNFTLQQDIFKNQEFLSSLELEFETSQSR